MLATLVFYFTVDSRERCTPRFVRLPNDDA
jgi:hypothetical protein